MRIKPILYVAFGAIIGAGIISTFSFKEMNEDEELVTVKKSKKLQYKWFVPDLPEQISFAGEPVPMNRQDIREMLEHEVMSNAYRHANTMQIILLSGRYFPLIEARLKANGVPDDFKYLCVAESSLTPARSPVGARGFWQFMDGTAPKYGLEISKDVDERYHVEKATDAACKYLKEAYAKFGSWTAAAASYNCGMAGYSKNAEFQLQDDYDDVLLPEETMRYVFRIVAFKHIMSNPEDLGFQVTTQQGYKPYAIRKATVTQTIPNLAEYAINNGTTYRTLKTMNPWLREHSLTVTGGKSYVIDLPK